MGYVTVKANTASKLCLLREPSLLSKSVFVGFFVGVLGIFIYGSESLFFKALIGACAACLSCLIVDNYEICEFDKEKSEVKITRLHWFQYLLNELGLLPAQPYVTACMNDIKDVQVEEQGGASSNTNKAYQVILALESGIQLGITEVFTTDDISVHEDVAGKIRSFLGSPLPPLRADDEADDEQDDDDEDKERVEDQDDALHASSSGSDVEDFEQISKEDLEGIADQDIAQLAAMQDTRQVSPGQNDGAGDASITQSDNYNEDSPKDVPDC